MDGKGNHILLIGGGHAHVAVLADWIHRGCPFDWATLVTPSEHLQYSGMVPGWIAGRYSPGQGRVDIAGLARRAGVDLILGKCAAIDPDARLAETDDGKSIPFTAASIDTGGVGRARSVLGDDPRILDIRPIGGFVRAVGSIPSDDRIAVVGGGAGGVEIAFAIKNRGEHTAKHHVTLITGRQGLLPDFGLSVRNRVAREMKRQGIGVIAADAKIEGGELIAGHEVVEPVDRIIAVTGSGAPDWPRAGGLNCDEHGFVAVDRHQRSISHDHIFAAGDVAARQDRAIPHSGVHAVFAGPVLANNLRAYCAGKPITQSYQPRRSSLYLMATGDGSAIASYGCLSAQGRWVARLKHWIDNRWISKYADLAKL